MALIYIVTEWLLCSWYHPHGIHHEINYAELFMISCTQHSLRNYRHMYMYLFMIIIYTAFIMKLCIICSYIHNIHCEIMHTCSCCYSHSICHSAMCICHEIIHSWSWFIHTIYIMKLCILVTLCTVFIMK